MSKLTPKSRRVLSCGVILLASMLLLSWRLWSPTYRAYESFWGTDVLQITVYLELAFVAVFLITISLKLPILDYAKTLLEKLHLFSPAATVLVSVGVILAGAGIHALNKAVLNTNATGSTEYTICAFFWLIYLLAKGYPSMEQSEKAIPWRLLAGPIVVALSKAVTQGFAPAFFITVTLAISDLLSVVCGKARLDFRSIAYILLPSILCVGLILAAKALFFPDILNYQLRTLLGTAGRVYSLGGYIDCIRESGEVMAHGCLYLIILSLGTVLSSILATRSEDKYRSRLLGLTACFFVLIWLFQALTNAELMSRTLLPYRWMVSGGLAAILSNGVMQGRTEDAVSGKSNQTIEVRKKHTHIRCD